MGSGHNSSCWRVNTARLADSKGVAKNHPFFYFMLKIIGKNIHLSIAEQEWLTVMQRMYGCTEQEALKEIIDYKREQAFGYEQTGNFALAKFLLQQIDEWDDTREQQFKEREEQLKERTLILPDFIRK